MVRCSCLPSSVPTPSYGCGVYQISGIGVNSGTRKTFTVSVACLSKWQSGGGKFDAFDWCDLSNGYNYFYNLAGEDCKLGTGTINQTGPCPVSQKFDCINGNCLDADKYTTPGIYQSLSDCQAVCANGGACASGKQCVDPTTFCPPGQVCIDQGEFGSIEALISQIGSEVC